MENCHILGVMAGSEHLKTAELSPMVCVAHKCNVPVSKKKKLIRGTGYIRSNMEIPEES